MHIINNMIHWLLLLPSSKHPLHFLTPIIPHACTINLIYYRLENNFTNTNLYIVSSSQSIQMLSFREKQSNLRYIRV